MSLRALLPLWMMMAALTPLGIAGQCESLRGSNLSLPDSSDLKCGHVCPGEHGWKMVPVLWAPLEVEINCSSSSFTVLTGHSQEQLVSEGSPIKWCGWHQVLKDPRVCRFKLSPLQDQYLAVDPAKSGGILPGGSPFTCVVNSTRELSIRDMILTIVGILLFSNAGRLTMNEYFRLSSGSLMFMSGAVVVLTFILMRSVPYKRSMAAIFTVSSTSLLAIVRWLYGTWLPDAHTLIFSRPFAIYMAVTAVVGWGVTYWLDDVHNMKLNNTIRVTLQMAGLFMVYLGISDERVAVAAAVVLVFNRVLRAFGRWLGWLLWWSTQAIGTVLQLGYKTVRYLVSSLLLGSWQLLCTSSKLVRGAFSSRVVRSPSPSGNAPTGAATRTSAVAGRVSQDAALTAPRAEASRAKRAGRSKRQQQALAAAADRLLSSDEEPELSPMPYERSKNKSGWSVLRYKSGPPPSPRVLAQQARHAASAGFGSWFGAIAQRAADNERMAYRFPSSTLPAAGDTPAAVPAAATSSPWSNEKVAVDINQRTVSSPSATGAASAKSPWSHEKVVFDDSRRRPAPASAAVSPAVYEQQQEAAVSPLVAAGRIINPATGRPIAMNKATYNQLLAQGYVPDLQNGILVSPGSPASPADSLRQRRLGTSTPR